MIVAAMAVEDRATIADPFRSTAPIVAMLQLHADQLHGPAPAPAARGCRSAACVRTPRPRPRLLAPAG